MIPSAFTYVRATDLADALRLLADGGDDAKLLAGGQSLIPMMKLRVANPRLIVDLGDIAGLRTIDASANPVRIGALATHDRIAADAAVAAAVPALSDAANVIGDPQIRNFGTIGGSSVHSDPGADYPAVLLALNATFSLTSASGVRDVRVDDFFVGMYETSLHADREILTEVSIVHAPASAYVKIEHPASGYAIAGGAARLDLTGGAITAARIAITGVGDIAFRARGVEAGLIGVRATDDDAIERACRGTADGIDPQGDVLCPSDYRFAMADVVAMRAIRRALRRGETHS
jgi:carbon-monoxide dehydrogenase medium subunit